MKPSLTTSAKRQTSIRINFNDTETKAIEALMTNLNISRLHDLLRYLITDKYNETRIFEAKYVKPNSARNSELREIRRKVDTLSLLTNEEINAFLQEIGYFELYADNLKEGYQFAVETDALGVRMFNTIYPQGAGRSNTFTLDELKADVKRFLKTNK